MPGLGVYIDVACVCMDHLSSRWHATLWPSVATAQLSLAMLGSPLPTSALAVAPPTAKAALTLSHILAHTIAAYTCPAKSMNGARW